MRFAHQVAGRSWTDGDSVTGIPGKFSAALLPVVQMMRLRNICDIPTIHRVLHEDPTDQSQRALSRSSGAPRTLAQSGALHLNDGTAQRSGFGHHRNGDKGKRRPRWFVPRRGTMS